MIESIPFNFALRPAPCCYRDNPHPINRPASYLYTSCFVDRPPCRAQVTHKIGGGRAPPALLCGLPASKSSIAAGDAAALVAARYGVYVVGQLLLLLHERELLRRLYLQVVEGAYGMEKRGGNWSSQMSSQ